GKGPWRLNWRWRGKSSSFSWLSRYSWPSSKRSCGCSEGDKDERTEMSGFDRGSVDSDLQRRGGGDGWGDGGSLGCTGGSRDDRRRLDGSGSDRSGRDGRGGLGDRDSRD